MAAAAIRSSLQQHNRQHRNRFCFCFPCNTPPLRARRYFSTRDFFWEGDYYTYPAEPSLLGRFPATVEGSISDIADYSGSPGYAATNLSTGLTALYYGGPTRGWKDTPSSLPAGTHVLATFSEVGRSTNCTLLLPVLLFFSSHPARWSRIAAAAWLSARRERPLSALCEIPVKSWPRLVL